MIENFGLLYMLVGALIFFVAFWPAKPARIEPITVVFAFFYIVIAWPMLFLIWLFD
jgi:hypothetical protein